MADKWDVRFSLPPKSAPDVVNRKLRVESSGTDSGSVVFEDDLAGDAVLSRYYRLDEAAVVHVELRDTDNAGQDSEPSVLDFTVTDDVPPPVPGAVSIDDKVEVVEP